MIDVDSSQCICDDCIHSDHECDYRAIIIGIQKIMERIDLWQAVDATDLRIRFGLTVQCFVDNCGGFRSREEIL